MKTRLVLTLAALIVLGLTRTPAPASAGEAAAPTLSAEEQWIYDQLLAFDDALQHRLQYIEKMAGASRVPGMDLGREAERFHRRLRIIEGEVRALEPSAPMTTALLDQVRALARVLRNLERAAEVAARKPVDLAALRSILPTSDIPPVRVPVKAEPPENDDWVGAVPIGNGTLVGATSSATSSPEPLCGCEFTELSPDVWFKYSSPVQGRVFAHTYGSDFDTVLSVYRGSPEGGICPIACNDNSLGLRSAVDFEYRQYDDYYLRVAGFAGAAGHYLLTVGPAGAISGTVSDAETGDPISSIGVFALSESGNYVNGGETDPAGDYTITGLPAATYYVRVIAASEYVAEAYDDLPCPRGHCDPAAGKPVQVTLDALTPGIDFALDLGGKITGSVVAAEAGPPITSARVEIFDDEGTRVTGAHSSDSGRWDVAGLVTGSYFATVDTDRYRDELYNSLPCPGGGSSGCDPTTGTPIAVSLGSTTDSIDFVLERFGEISGTVTDRTTGEPVNAEVRVWNADGLADSTWTDYSGRFSIAGLVADTYFAQATSDDHLGMIHDSQPCFSQEWWECDPAAGTPITVSENATTSGIDFVLPRLGAIAGTVTEAATGQPVQEDWAAVEVWHIDGYWAGQGRLDAAGQYTVNRIRPDTCFARIHTSQYLDEVYDDLPCPSCDPASGTPIPVELEATTDGIDFALVELGAIAGKVSEEATGEPIENAWVRLWDTDYGWIRETFTDTEGRYRFSGLDADVPYFVTAQSAGYAGEVYENLPCPDEGCDPTSGTPIAAAIGTATDGIDFRLTGLTSILGTVEAATTGATLGACVDIWDANGSHAGTGCVEFTAGVLWHLYEVRLPAAGTYFATASEEGYGRGLYDGRSCPDDCDPTSGTPITVELQRATMGVDFYLNRWGQLTGRVTNASTGEPTGSETWVSVWNQAGEQVDRALVSWEYWTKPLPPGTYFATAQADGYFGELHREIPCPEACDPTTGTPIEVRLEEVTDVSFSLEPKPTDLPGGFAGTATDTLTGETIRQLEVVIWDENGEWADSTYSDDFGRYAEYLRPGSYFVAAAVWDSRYRGELFDDLPCDFDALAGCDPTTGTPIVVQPSRMTQGIDFQLHPAGAPACIPTATALCLTDDRFRVEVDWRDHQSGTGAGQGVELTGDTGYFWFFGPDNVEAVLKVLDACYTPYDRFWVYAAGLTDVECALTVTDTWTGEVRTWANPLGVPFAPIQDTAAFATCDAVSPSEAAPEAAAEELERLLAELDRQPLPARWATPFAPLGFTDKGDCVTGDTALCLSSGRFQVEVFWRTPAGDSGAGHAVPLTADTGYFWFFGPDNVEVVVKVLDACYAPFDRFWVYAAGLTDVEVTLRLTDTVAGEIREYSNPMGTAFAPIQDTDAFDTCP